MVNSENEFHFVHISKIINKINEYRVEHVPHLHGTRLCDMTCCKCMKVGSKY